MRKRNALSFRDTSAAADWEKGEARKCLAFTCCGTASVHIEKDTGRPPRCACGDGKGEPLRLRYGT